MFVSIVSSDYMGLEISCLQKLMGQGGFELNALEMGKGATACVFHKGWGERLATAESCRSPLEILVDTEGNEVVLARTGEFIRMVLKGLEAAGPQLRGVRRAHVRTEQDWCPFLDIDRTDYGLAARVVVENHTYTICYHDWSSPSMDKARAEMDRMLIHRLPTFIEDIYSSLKP